MFKDKRISAIFTVVFTFLLIMVVFVIAKSDFGKTKKHQELSAEDIESLVAAGDFLSPSLRSVDDSDVFLGKKNADVELIVYEDLSSYYSAEFSKTIDSIRQNFGDKVLVAFRPYANKMFPLSISTNLWAQCAMEQGKFFEARKLLLKQAENETLSEEYFSNYAKEIGLNLDSLEKCVKGEKYLAKLEGLKKEAERFDVYGAPTVFVNNEMIIGARSFEDVTNGDGQNLEGMKNIISRNLK